MQVYSSITTKTIILTLISGILLMSCLREISNELGTIPVTLDTARIYHKPAIDAPTVKFNLSVFVYDKNNKPVNNATITAGNNIVNTDTAGYAFMKDIVLSKVNAFIKISKVGFFSTTRSFSAASGRWNYVKVEMREQILQGTVNSSEGGEVSFAGGGKIVLPSNSLNVASSKQAYNGPVRIYSSFIDPSNALFLDQMPGDLRGILINGDERQLISYGMLQVELKGNSDELLQLKNGQKSKLVFPIPTSIAASAPNNIALWYFADSLGRWMEESTALKKGNNYETEVKHFSIWNCDYAMPYPLTDFEAVVVNSKNTPIFNAHILIRPQGDSWGGHGFTDINGHFTGRVPINTPLVFEVIVNGMDGVCKFFSMPLGPFTGPVTNDTITLSNVSKTISGSLYDCNNLPVKNGFVQINIPTLLSYRLPINNGNFLLDFISCQPIGDITIFGVDQNSNTQSIPATYNFQGSNIINANIQACGISATEWVKLKTDSVAYEMNNPPNDSIYKYQLKGDSPQNQSPKYLNNVYSKLKGSSIGIDFSFTTSASSPGIGSYLLNNLILYGTNFKVASIISASPQVIITEWGSSGTFMIGTFAVQVLDSNNIVHDISVDFRLRN